MPGSARMTAVPPFIETAGPPLERQALLLAELLRSSRVTLLCGAAGSGKSTLLRHAVMPLPGPELALIFDDWRADPLPRLCHQLALALGRAGGEDKRSPWALPELIRIAGREQGIRPLIVFDAFERHLALPPLRTDVQRFDEHFLQAVNDPSLDAHFLISMRVEAKPLLERFRGRLHGLERNWLNLPAPRATLVVLPPAEPEAAAEVAPVPARPPEPVPEPVQRLMALAASPRAAEHGPRRRQVALLSGLSALALVALLALWSWPRHRADLPDLAQLGAAPGAGAPASAAAASSPLPSPSAWPVQTGAAQRTDARVASELMQHLPPTLRGPPLRIVHYDALQAARQDQNAAWRVVAPLFPEELHLVVRADSPLTYIHQIRGHSIDLGLATPGRPPTAAMLYERLFGEPLPPALARNTGWPDALAALAAGRTDVAVLVDAQPSSGWLALTPAQRAGLKLLALDPAAPESRRALQGFLPATLHPPGAAPAGVPSLALMSFLAVDDTPAVPGPPSAAQPAGAADEALLQLARSLCAALPTLRRDGHPKWREARPSLYLPVGWPYVEAAHQTLKHCPPDAAPRPSTAQGDSR